MSTFPYRFISDFSLAYKKKHKNGDIDFIISRREKKALLLANNFITRESTRMLSTSFYFLLLRIAHATHTCPRTLPQSPTHVYEGGLHHFPDDV